MLRKNKTSVVPRLWNVGGGRPSGRSRGVGFFLLSALCAGVLACADDVEAWASQSSPAQSGPSAVQAPAVQAPALRAPALRERERAVFLLRDEEDSLPQRAGTLVYELVQRLRTTPRQGVLIDSYAAREQDTSRQQSMRRAMVRAVQLREQLAGNGIARDRIRVQLFVAEDLVERLVLELVPVAELEDAARQPRTVR